jgi:hypothetical protein
MAQAMTRSPALLALLMLVGCRTDLHPPPTRAFEGLPIAGSLADARAAGFAGCIEDTTTMRCRREGVMLAGAGPYAAAVDLAGSDGGGGFNHLTLWHGSDQGALLAIGDALKRQGWHSCLKGEQEDYTRPGSPIRIAIDVTYWGKRRAVITHEGMEAKPRC